MGPAVTPRWLLPDPDDQRLRLWVNDELKQDERAGDMLVGLAELVAAASARVTLEPGDVIAAGTPAGVGMPRAEFLTPATSSRGDRGPRHLAQPGGHPHPGGHRHPGWPRHEAAEQPMVQHPARVRGAREGGGEPSGVGEPASGSPAVTYSHTRSARRSAQLATCGGATVGAAGSLRSAAAAACVEEDREREGLRRRLPHHDRPAVAHEGGARAERGGQRGGARVVRGRLGPAWRTGPAPK